jgi:hypothetical protein
MDARTSKRQKKISAKQEKRLARDLGGKTQPASGAMPNAKSDVRAVGSVRAEAKYTAKSSFSLKLADLEKIVGEAGLEMAVLQLCFVDRANRPVLEVAIFPLSQMAGGIIGTAKADYQTFSKSLHLDRDRITLKLMKGDMYIVFSKGRTRWPLSEHHWFRMMEWKTT